MADVRASTTEFRDLVKVLAVERNLLEYVLYRLVSAKLVLTTGDQRYVMQSLVEVEDAVDRLRDVAFKREKLVQDLADTVDSGPVTITRLTELAPSAERYMLVELQADYLRLAHQIAQVSAENRRLTELSLGPTAELLKQFAGSPTGTTYDGGGLTATDRPNPVRID